MFYPIKIQFLKASDSYKNKVLDYYQKLLEGFDKISFTSSGSTGKPKDIILEYENIAQSAENTIEYFQLSENQNILLCLNIDFIAGFMVLARAMKAKMNLYVVEPSQNPFDYLPQNLYFNFVSLVPTQILYLTENKLKLINSKFKFVLIGGASINEKIKKDFIYAKINAFESYGMTETISHIALKKIEEPYFTALKNISISVDKNNRLVIKLLYNNPITIVTNDVVELINSSQFKYVGRFDNIINSGAIKISLDEVEKIVSNILIEKKVDLVFFIWKKSHPIWGEIPVIIYKKNHFNLNEINNEIIKEVNSIYNINILSLKNFETREVIVFTPSLKIDREKSYQS